MTAEPSRRTKLRLVASPGSWRLFSARKADERFRSFEQKVLQRDRYTCQFCGFQARLFQDIINLDGNYSNNRLSNLVTACVFCSQCFFLESCGVGGFGGGTLIYLPELTQEELNSLCHVLFCAITNDTGYRTSAQNIYRSFKQRATEVEEKFGEGTSDPAVFGQMLIDAGATASDTMQKLFLNVRLLPSRAKFRKQIEQWAASALEEMGERQGKQG